MEGFVCLLPSLADDLELDPSMIANIPALYVERDGRVLNYVSHVSSYYRGQSAGFEQVQQLKAKQDNLVAQLDVLEPGPEFDLVRDLRGDKRELNTVYVVDLMLPCTCSCPALWPRYPSR